MWVRKQGRNAQLPDQVITHTADNLRLFQKDTPRAMQSSGKKLAVSEPAMR